MADLCTPILVLTMNAVGCFAAPTCQPAIDGQHSICTSPSICKPPPAQFNCVRADGAHYIWEGPLWPDSGAGDAQ